MFAVSMGSRVRALRGSVQMRWLVPALALGGFALAAPHILSQASGGGLQQSIDTIRQILAADGLYTRTTTSALNNYKSATERHYSLTGANGCNLTFATDTHIHTEMPAQNRVTDRKSTDIFKPDFSTLDASSVHVGDPQPAQGTWEMKGYLVRIAVQIGKPRIEASSLDRETNEAHELPAVPMLAVYVSSRESADKLAKAFAQVATACHAAPAKK